MRNMRCPQENQVTRLGPAPDEIPIPLKPDQRAKSEPFGEEYVLYRMRTVAAPDAPRAAPPAAPTR